MGDDVVFIPPVSIAAGAVIRESVIGPYVHVGIGCRIERSVVGPHVSLAEGSSVVQSIIYDAIVDADGAIEDATLCSSLVGEAARVRGRFGRFNVGDSSEIDSGATTGGRRRDDAASAMEPPS